MDIDAIKVGTKVIYAGLEAKVTKVIPFNPNLIEVEYEGGAIITPRTTFDGRSMNSYIVTL